MNKKALIAVICAVAAIAAVILIITLPGDKKPYETTGFAMGSAVTVKLYDSEEAAADTAGSILDSIKELDSMISDTLPGSYVSRLNSASVGIQASESFMDLMDRCRVDSVITNGAFDATVGTLSALWANARETGIVPDEKAVAEALGVVGWQQLQIDRDRKLVMKGEGQLIDFGAAGKGAACDAAYDVLRSGSVSAVVTVGGSALVYGNPAKGSFWTIGVRDPDGSENDLKCTLKIKPGENSSAAFISTSGDYERYFESDGKRYHHIIDPVTGYPSDSGLRSVTVVSYVSGFDSDALATAFFVMGEQKALPIAEALGVDVLFIRSDGSVSATEGLEFDPGSRQ